ncbi:LysR family transcriptional regulator [Kangiella sp. HZ709]|uniref:LysR family transcriptional regulator n=1 Tax=Kangiella sp. HZ709 TaxID=2666328 RepID=UPI0012B10531|nr:LysR family transcriptional regulator [Kangiella sp. HZ709]MRX26879.1 LysR family transcriptional regulator [Kangiella sp. HZ709]
MGQLEFMKIFVRVVEAGTITLAAEQLSMTKSAVSKRLSELESNLGTKLLNRTTRSSSLTEAGNNYYNRAKDLILEIEELNQDITSSNKTLEGKLKVALPLSFGINHLLPFFNAFLKAHPRIQLETNFCEYQVDMVEQGYDLAFRIGNLSDSTLQARKLVNIEHCICASPDYINEVGPLNDIKQLSKLKYLKYDNRPSEQITFNHKSGVRTVLLNSYTSSNSGEFLTSLAKAGHGFVILPTFILWKEIKNKSLVPLFSEYKIPTMHGYAIYPANRYLPSKVRALIDFLTQCFGTPHYWDVY